MKSAYRFLHSLVREIMKDDLMSLANALTYNLLLALFPFLIFLMAVLGFLNIDGTGIVAEFSESFPPQVTNIINVFVTEVLESRSLSLLSASLLITVYSASSGFRAVIKGINKSYGSKETRSSLAVHVISVGLVFLFTLAIVICFVALIFGDHLISLADRYYTVSSLGHTVFALVRSFGVMIALLAAVCIIYKFSSVKKVRFLSVLPGGAVTVVFWVLASKAFEIYITNFSRFSIIYGSLASVFILMIWLNLISFVLLIGSEINALLAVEG